MGNCGAIAMIGASTAYCGDPCVRIPESLRLAGCQLAYTYAAANSRYQNGVRSTRWL